ncbi:briggsae CBR-RNR-1 protein [Ganoderma leucocontextum]|nr:briggsae CBR-RNR-1 protein [Ganoderma leucocontextum]
MNGGRSRLIRLPADSPFTEDPGAHIWPEDLHTRRWFSRGSQRRRISTLPIDATFDLPANYSIVTSRYSATAPVNRNVYDNWGLIVRGHVIVIRHSRPSSVYVHMAVAEPFVRGLPPTGWVIVRRIISPNVESNLRALSWGMDLEFVDIPEVVDNLVVRLPGDTMDAETFQIFLAEIVSTFSARHPDYSILAGRVYVSYIHKRVPKRFSTWVFYQANLSLPTLPPTFIDVVNRNLERLDAAIMHHRDFEFTYHALQSFERSYLLCKGRQADERLQFMYMRVAIGIHGNNIDDVLETYELLSTRRISVASPVLWNGGLSKRNFASCYIFEPYAVEATDATSNFADLSTLWSADGGIGIHAGEIPATRGRPGEKHPGLMPLLRVYDSLAGYWSHSSRHRSSSATVHLPIWHADVRKFVVCRTNRASTGYRLRHIFPALWIPNLFMNRLEANKNWSFFDPADVRPLTDLVGDAFVSAYESYERDGLAIATVPARMLWDIVSGALRESARNNHMHLGIVKSSNLCTEIVQYSSSIETAVCTLAALCLPRYVRDDTTFDYDELHRVTKIVVRILNKLIDDAHFPTQEAAVSAYGTRSIGVGVQGLADVFAIMELPFTSVQARAINIRIFETIYHAALETSCELAEESGPYAMWQGSPASNGLLQVDMWGAEPTNRYDFVGLRQKIAQFGLHNSMLTAQMPTASTAQLLGNSEGIEPYTSNVLQYRVLSGSFNELSRHLVNALRKRGLWSERVRNDLLASHGSIQTVVGIPDDVKAIFRTAFELDPHALIDMAVDHSPFIDQSQSFSMFVARPTPPLLMELQLHAWRSGLKTGAYYVRSKPSTEPQPFGISRSSLSTSPASPHTSTSSPGLASAVCPCDV